jgi:hypothetical protein
MGVFFSSKTYNALPSIIEIVVNDVLERIKGEGYEATREILDSGGAVISIAKGGSVKAALGLKTALKVTIQPNGSQSFTAEAGVGIFGTQALPTAGMMVVAWPIIIPQIWGLIQQSKLDDHVLDLIQQSVIKFSASKKSNQDPDLFCPHCGHGLTNGTKFCSECGGKI